MLKVPATAPLFALTSKNLHPIWTGVDLCKSLVDLLTKLVARPSFISYEMPRRRIAAKFRTFGPVFLSLVLEQFAMASKSIEAVQTFGKKVGYGLQYFQT